LPPKQALYVKAWATIHQDELKANWELAQMDEILYKIEPLKRGARDLESNRMLSPDAVEVRALDGYILRVHFAHGELRDFDAKQMLDRKCFHRLKNPGLVKTARIAYGTVVWTEELDMDPEWLCEERYRFPDNNFSAVKWLL
jgi:hypothetical protein